MIVDAHTFTPIEMIYHRPSGAAPTLVVLARSYEELPATKTNLGLVRLTHHTSARIVNVKGQAER
jgi:hypothetical protein